MDQRGAINQSITKDELIKTFPTCFKRCNLSSVWMNSKMKKIKEEFTHALKRSY